MREHLYQGKRKDNGEWVQGDLIHRQIWASSLCIIRVSDDGFDNYEEYEVDPETVSEFTGQYDINRKRIFEGHIVRVTTPRGNIGIVLFQIGEYFDGEEHYIGVYGMFGGKSAAILARREVHYEVIGNKWDDPELLQEA